MSSDVDSLGSYDGAPSQSAGRFQSPLRKQDTSEFRLEPHLHRPYALWKENPSPLHTTVLLDKVKPAIDHAIKAYVQGVPSPMTRSKAKQLAIEAFHTYDPRQAQLNTHLINHLKRLQRSSAREANFIHIPEQLSLDRQHLHEAHLDLADSLGREPTTDELADQIGLSKRRIGYLRSVKSPVAEGWMRSRHLGEEDYDPSVEAQPHNEAAELLYDSLDDPTDKLILEHGIGLHGHDQKHSSVIGKMLNISPSAVSQRAAKLQSSLDDINAANLF